MTIRHAAKAVALTGAVASVGALSALAFSGTAGASIPSGGQTQAITPSGAFTPGTPFSSGQTVNVDVGPSALAPFVDVKIVECAAPNGVLPTNVNQCDNNTLSADTIIPAADGSFKYDGKYQVYALPSLALGETASNPVTCGNTAATECVLIMTDDTTSLTAPHVFSQPFKIQVNDPAETGVNPGDGTPEVPLAVALPLAAAGLMAGGLVIRRRRANSAA